MTKFLLLFCLLGLACGLHLSHAEQQTQVEKLKPGKYRFQNGDGKYLGHVRIRPLIDPSQIQRLTITDSATDSSTIWEVKKQGSKFKISTTITPKVRPNLYASKNGHIIVGFNREGYDDGWYPEQYDDKWAFRSTHAGYLGICTSRYDEMSVCARRDASPWSSFTWTLTEVTDE